MAIITSVPTGSPLSIAQNAVIALPPIECNVLSQTALEHSVDGSTFVALANSTTTGAITAAGWVRCTTGATIIIVKRA